MFIRGICSVIINEIVKKKVIIAGIWPVYSDSVAINQFSSFAPELFLAMAITVIWCYLVVNTGRGALINLRYSLFIVLFLYVCVISWQGVMLGGDLITNNNQFVLFSKIIIVVIALPVLWLENLSITLALYFSALILFNLGLIGSADLLTTYVCLEGLSLVSYGVIATNKTRGSAESGLKYFLYGIVASALLVFGLSLLYLQSHELKWAEVYLFFAFHASNQVEVRVLSILLITAALIYKLSLFPFHFTLPDVYEGTSWHTIAVINVGVKLGVSLFLFRLWGIIVVDYVLSEYISIILSWFAIASLLIGCFGALVQTSIRRFFAYTSINQAGFIIMGLLTNSIFGLEASILYVVVYMLSMILFFYAVDGITSDDIGEVNNLGGTRKLSLSSALFSMAGIPPLLGFGSKYIMWLSLFDSVSTEMLNAHHNNAIKCLLVASILMSLISGFYYLRMIKITSFRDSLVMGINGSHSNYFISLSIVGILILWPLFLGVLLNVLEKYSLLNYGSWIDFF